MDNKRLIENLYHLAAAIREKNNTRALGLDKAIISLLEYEGPLANISSEELMKINGIGKKNVDYVFKLFNGESIERIIESVPKKEIYDWETRRTRHNYGNGMWQEGGNSFDNSVRAIEDK